MKRGQEEESGLQKIYVAKDVGLAILIIIIGFFFTICLVAPYLAGK